MAAKAYITLLGFLLLSFLGAAQLYIFDVKDPSTYSYDCGTTTGAYWGVKGDSCSLVTTPTGIHSACVSTGLVTLPIKVTINQTGQLACTDTAWIHYTVNAGATWIPLDTIIGCEQTANLPYWYYPDIPNNSTFQLKVTFDNGAPNDWWQIKDGDIVINDPCFLLPLGWISVDGRAALLDNVLQLTYEYGADEVDTVLVERSKDGAHFAPIVVDIQSKPGALATYVIRDRQPLISKSYYRIVVVHVDGTPSVSDIVMINRLFNDVDHLLSFFPNPTTDKIQFRPLPAGVSHATIKIIDLFGRVVFYFNWEWGMQWLANLDVGQFAPGEYIVQLTTDGTTEQRKLLIQ